MTLGRLIELYQAEQSGKTIMCKTKHLGYYNSYTHIDEVKLSEIDLKDLIFDEEESESVKTYLFIKDEEDEYGFKLNKE